MRSRPCPRGAAGSRRRLRSALPIVVALGGAVLVGLIPASAAAATHHAARFAVDPAIGHAMRPGIGHAMGHVPLVQAIVQQVPTDPSMAPLPEPKEVQAGPELRRVLENILCQCGCNLTAYACEGSMVCDVSAQMRADAELMIADGMSSDEALDAFAADYGEGVLAAPRKSGFDLTAWVLPFLVLGVGGLVVAVAIRSWRPEAATATAGPVPQADPKYVAEVEAELERED